jgi:hypothetical protein
MGPPGEILGGFSFTRQDRNKTTKCDRHYSGRIARMGSMAPEAHMTLSRGGSAMTNKIVAGQDRISAEALAMLGGGKIAYIRQVSWEEAQSHFPQVPRLEPGTLLYALHAADGTPIMLTDSREAAIANAWQQELQTVSLH